MPSKNIIKNKTNKRYGKLTVLRHCGSNSFGSALWECLCDCGNITYVSTGHLSEKQHGTKSCGCLQKQRIHESKALTPGQAGFNYLFRVYKNAACSKNREFCISKEQFNKLVTSECYYCGIKPYNTIKNGNDKTSHSEFIYNGIDRKDNSIGYIIENCVTCCKSCNYAKKNLSESDFIKLCKRVTLFQDEKSKNACNELTKLSQDLKLYDNDR